MGVLIPFLQGLVNIFFSARYRVEGDSMLPSFTNRQSLLVVDTRFSWNKLRRGDVVVFAGPEGREGFYIKRVVGLPGEDLKTVGGKVFLDGNLLEEDYIQESAGPGAKNADDDDEREWFNGPDEYFLMGDNRGDSDDSRNFGPVPGESIKGRAWFQYWPPWKWRPISRS